MRILKYFIFIFALSFSQMTEAEEQNSFLRDAKLTVGLPLYVAHSSDRPNGQEWNDGWFQNEGIFGDISWPVYSFSPSTSLRAGGTAGVFDNSIFNTSFFLGGMTEVESFATEKLSFNLGGYAGVITGYDNSFLQPAVAPYLGTAYSATETIDFGLRGLWLPARTLAGEDIAGSDAYVATFTISKRF